MPKVLVLFDDRRDDAAHTARAIATGAESVRFTEVETRALDGGEDVTQYDGVVLVAAGESAAAATAPLAGPLADKVGAVVDSSGRDALAPLATMLRAGMIVVGAGVDGDVRALGARVAKVTEWIRHARSHSHSHSHSH